VHGAREIYLILTHHHPDHTFGMKVFVANGAHVIAHQETCELFRYEGDRYRDFIIERFYRSREDAMQVLGEVELTPPRTTIVHDEVVIVDGEELHLLHTPGHVKGQLCVYHPSSRVLFAGDALSGGAPDTQYSKPGGWKLWMDQLHRLRDLPINHVVPGHGPVAGSGIIKDNIIYLRLALGRQSHQLFHVLKRKKCGSVLDLSLTNARTALFLARLGFSVTGVDQDAECGAAFLDEARREHLSVRFIEGAPQDFPFGEDYDVMIATNILYRLDEQAAHALLDTMRAHTRPGGINVLTVFSAAEPTKGARYLFAPEALRGRYADWNLLHFEEGRTPMHTDHDDDEPHRHALVMLVAERP